MTRSTPVGNNGFGAGNIFVTGPAPGLRRAAEMVVGVRIVLFEGRLISEPSGVGADTRLLPGRTRFGKFFAAIVDNSCEPQSMWTTRLPWAS